MIRSYMAGVAVRQSREKQEAEQERNKIEMDLLQHRIKQMKLAERIEAWKMNVEGAESQAKSMEGLPMAEMPAAFRPGLESTDLSQVVSGMTPSGRNAQALAPPMPVAPITANQALPPPQQVMRPGLDIPEAGISVPAAPIRIRTKEQQDADVQREAALKASVTGQKLGYGEKFFLGNKVVAENTTQDPRDAETVRHNKAIEAEGRAREGRLGRESKDFITATIAQKAAQDLYANLDAIEAAFAPDPKAMEAYQASLEIWNNPTDEELKARTAASKPPRPPQPRLTEAQLEAKKLAAVNSYRAQMHLPKALTLPPEFRYKPEGTPAPAPGAGAVAPPPPDPGVPSSTAAPIVINTPMGPFRFTDPDAALKFANEAGLPAPPKLPRKPRLSAQTKSSRGSIQ
jgi:hypothetical protein